MKTSNVDNARNHRCRVVTFLAAVATLFILQSQSHALDVTLQWDANPESGVSGYIIYYKTGNSGDRIKEKYTNQVEVTPKMRTRIQISSNSR